MILIREKDLLFQFPDSWDACKYDDWSYYRKRFQRTCDSKAVDILALSPLQGGTLWLIEVKDYRRHRRQKPISIWDEMAFKVRDTLAGVFAAGRNADHDGEKGFARKCATSKRLRIVLHLEQPNKTSRLFPRTFNPANIEVKLKTLLKAVDAHPKVVDRIEAHVVLGWSVR